MPVHGNINSWIFQQNDGANIGGGETGPVDISDADELFWLDGTLDGDEFVDQTGNERNFTITNKDFTGSYFPYKSAATISAPVGDAVLIAADVNNFLYASDESPNEIPVVSFFQNIDYENKLFCKHTAQVVDGNGVETTEPHVKDIVLYSAALTGDDLTTANTYYSVPTELTGATIKWVSKDGNDTTGDGSKSNPWLTLSEVNSSAETDDTVYVKSGVYTEDGALGNLYQTRGLTFKGLGLVEVRQTDATSVMYITGNKKHEYNHMIFNAQGAAYNIRIYNNVINCTWNKCKFTGAATREIYYASTPAGTRAFNDCVMVSSADYGVYLTAGILMTGCYIDSTGTNFMQSISNAGVGDVVFKYNKVEYSGSNIFIFLNEVDQFDLDIRFNEIAISAGEGIQTTNQKETLCEYNRVTITSSGASAFQFGKSDATTPIANVKVNNNWVSTISQTTYAIKVGSDSGAIGPSNDQIANIEVIGNTVLGPIYHGVTQVDTTIHGILVGFQKNSHIKYNYVNGCNIGIIKKHSGVADTAGSISYNLIVDCLQGLYSKGSESILFYGNTIINTAWDGLRGIRLSENAGSDGAVNCVLRNNIIYNTIELDSERGLLVIGTSSLTGLDSDYNILYSTDDQIAYDGTDNYASLTLWKAEGYDANSDDSDPDLDSSYVPNTGSPAIGEGATLDAAYDDGLDASTDWGDADTVPSVVTKQQTGSWDIGAYIS